MAVEHGSACEHDGGVIGAGHHISLGVRGGVLAGELEEGGVDVGLDITVRDNASDDWAVGVARYFENSVHGRDPSVGGESTPGPWGTGGSEKTGVNARV
jgi:hypothetical protein